MYVCPTWKGEHFLETFLEIKEVVARKSFQKLGCPLPERRTNPKPEPWDEDSDEDSDASDEKDEEAEILRLTV